MEKTRYWHPVTLARRHFPQYELPPHIEDVYYRLLECWLTGSRLILTMPPRHGKTTSLLYFVAYLLLAHPVSVIWVSHTYEFAQFIGRKIRDIVDFFSYFGLPPLRSDSRASTQFELANGSSFYATGVGGGITGRGANLLVLDDVVKNVEQAMSVTIRNKTWDWFQSTARTRLEPHGKTIVVQTRWHRDDIVGRCLSEGDWKYISMPAIADGKPLWASRFTLEMLEVKRKEIGEFWFEAQYLCNPKIQQGALFDGVHYYDQLPNAGYEVVGGLDLAYSASQFSDWTAAVIARIVGDVAYIEHAEWWQSDISSSIGRLRMLQSKYGCDWTVEANGPQLAVFDMLRQNGLRVRRARPDLVRLDKTTRALRTADKWNRGEILVPSADTPWKHRYIEAILGFCGRNDVLDDLVDATVYAVDRTGTNVFVF